MSAHLRSGKSLSTNSFVSSNLQAPVDGTVRYTLLEYRKHSQDFGEDMDILEVGNPALIADEQQTHFASWVAAK
jgi:hypothetical protein